MLRTIVKNDLKRYFVNSNKRNFIKALIFIPGFRYTFFLRFSQSTNVIIRIFGRMFLLITSIMYGYQISHVTQIGKGLYIGHFGSLIINGNAILGDNCNLAPGVVIGQSNRGGKKGVPVLGNKVWVGSNAILVGGIKIDDNVLIAPGAYVNFDIPKNSIVIGNPGKVITKDSSINVTDGYIHNIV